MSNKKLPEKYNSEIAQLNEEIELLKKEILKRKKKIIKIRKNKNLDKTAIKWYNIFRKKKNPIKEGKNYEKTKNNKWASSYWNWKKSI